MSYYGRKVKEKITFRLFLFQYDILVYEVIMSSFPKVLVGMVLSLSLFSGVVSCTSCSKTKVTDPPKPLPTVSVVVPPLPTTQLVESHKASVTIPITFQDQRADGPDSPNYRLFANSSNKELISLDAEVYASSYEEYVLEAIRFLKERNAVVQTATSVSLNGQQVTMLESSTQGVVAYFWITTKNGYGYTFTCGGLETSSTVKGMCANLATTFHVE